MSAAGQEKLWNELQDARMKVRSLESELEVAQRSLRYAEEAAYAEYRRWVDLTRKSP
jgi:hypothetical protein